MTITKYDFFYVRNPKTVFVIAKPKGVNGDLPLLEKSKLDETLKDFMETFNSGLYKEIPQEVKSKVNGLLLEFFPYLQDEEQKK